MDRLFRKRTVSTKEAHGLPVRSNSFGNDVVFPEKAATLRKKSNGKGSKRDQPGRVETPVEREAPRVELNIRNSLMLPGLSQRFSVLLPSLSAIPADSLRDKLANQRQRGGRGPAITEEEEELLFAELQDIEAYKKNYQLSPLTPSDEWDGQPPLPPSFSSHSLASSDHGSRGYMSAYYTSDSLSGSTSTPNLLGAASSSTDALSPSSSSPPVSSPPPTSSSFDSFATFGVGGSSSGTSDERNSVRTKSYGFSGGSSMRDHDYIRRVKKSASTRNFSGSTSTSSRSLSMRSDDSEETASGVPGLPGISVDKANAYGLRARNGRGSPTGSDRTATPTSGYTSPLASTSTSLVKRNHSPSSSLSLNLPPAHPAPTAPLPKAPLAAPEGRSQRQRKSMLQGLTPAQMRRISAALIEIGHGHGLQERTGPGKEEKPEDEEETLQLEEEPQPVNRASGERQRYESNARSDTSEHSTGSSSIFPYYVSPTTSSFAAAVQPPSEPSSPPARVIPPSPKSRDLRAQINRPPSPPSPTIPYLSPTLPAQPLIIAEGSRPVPVLTPTKSRPVRHNSSLSTDSASPIASSIPRYIPGQPRPIGSASGRSDGSDSSRSATPTNSYAHRAGGSALAPSPNGYRNRSDSNPSPVRQPPGIASRTTSLARSQSVQQNNSQTGALSPPLSTQSHSSSGSADSVMFGVQRGVHQSLSQPAWGARRPNSPLVIEDQRDVIPEGDDEGHEEERNVRVYDVPSRRSVAHSRSDSASPIPRIPHAGVPRPDISRAPSQQGYISSYPEGSTDSHHDPIHSGLRRVISLESIGSSFNGSIGHSGDRDGGWSPQGEVVMTPEPEQIADLRELTGLEREELREMQFRLVDRAKAEREALLGGMAERSFSPVPQVSASRSVPLDLRAVSPAPPPTASQALSPPPMPTYRATTPDIIAPRQTPSSPVILGDILTPPSGPPRSVPVIADRRAAPPPPSAPSPPTQPPPEAHDEISTPTSEHLSRQASQRKASASTPGDDPEKIRDFEARIAAATAALNRTPTGGSGSGVKLERKNTKRGAGPMVISTPRLLSSSVNLSSKRIEPQSPDMVVDGHTAKALENASGSSKKMSLRWRKLGFGKKGPSISSTEIYSPPLPSSASASPNPQILEEPIALSPNQNLPTPSSAPSAPTQSNDLRGFKFPPHSASSDRPPMSSNNSNGSARSQGMAGLPSPPGTANPTSGLRQMMGKFRKGKSDEAEFFPPATVSETTPQPHPAVQAVVDATGQASRHVPTGSDDSAMAKFIAAGRAVGLNDAQLHEMLLANGMLQRSATTGSTRSAASNANTSGRSQGSPLPVTPPVVDAAPSPVLAAAQAQPGQETKEKSGGGIFRSLSRKKSKRDPPTSTERSIETTEARNKVVRRTLLLPEGYPVTPQPNRSPALHPSPSVTLDSPTNITFGRKPSTRRKPIPLTREDERLVADASSTRERNTSLTSVSTGISVERREGEEGPTAGLGFLHPSVGQKEQSSVGRESSGSFYDLYGNGEEGQGEGGNKGIEIMEYEDGRVVWGVIDALRDDEEASDSEYTQGGGAHSRQTSYASSHFASEAKEVAAANGWKGAVAPLQLRHRERGPIPPALRPETNLYFTSPTDIGDLIDQLSRDPSGNKGRIDFSSLSPDFAPSGSSAQPPQAATPPPRAAPGQFEDAPSPPRKTPPAPIVISRTNNIPAGGFSPKRQKHVRQGGFGRPGGGSLSGGLGPATASPSAASFASSQSGKPVEDRLQALMDRLVSSGATRKV